MKFSLAVTSPLLLLSTTTTGGVTAFAPSQCHHQQTHRSARGHLSMSSMEPSSPVSPIKKKVLTAADVISKSSSAGDPAGPGSEEAPKSFSPEIYDDFQSALLLLEKRAKGESSVSLEEVSTFEEETNRIVKEMKEYLEDPKGCEKRIRLGYEASAAGVEGVVVETKAAEVEKEAPPPAAAATIPPPPPATQTRSASPTHSLSTPSTTNNESLPNAPPQDEGDEGYGLALGGMAADTVNTYALEGMESMSPEEYRENLQKSISARQAKRRADSLTERGKIGNMNSSGYLDMLGGGDGLGAPGVVKAATVGGEKKDAEEQV